MSDAEHLRPLLEGLIVQQEMSGTKTPLKVAVHVTTDAFQISQAANSDLVRVLPRTTARYCGAFGSRYAVAFIAASSTSTSSTPLTLSAASSATSASVSAADFERPSTSTRYVCSLFACQSPEEVNGVIGVSPIYDLCKRKTTDVAFLNSALDPS